MINCRVFYKADGTISVMYPSPSVRIEGEIDEVFVKRICDKDAKKLGFENLPYDDIDKINLPPGRADRDKWRGDKSQGVYVDTTVITENERREAIQVQIDAELDKAVPNAGKILKLQRDLKTKPS